MSPHVPTVSQAGSPPALPAASLSRGRRGSQGSPILYKVLASQVTAEGALEAGLGVCPALQAPSGGGLENRPHERPHSRAEPAAPLAVAWKPRRALSPRHHVPLSGTQEECQGSSQASKTQSSKAA